MRAFYHNKILPIDRMSHLTNICPFKLNETFENLYGFQQKLGISDEYLWTISRDDEKGGVQIDRFRKLLDASKSTRDNLVTWHMKQALVELNVTISLLTAKIKLIEYKLGLCEGLDLHQACSLSLVNFCNILADMTVANKKIRRGTEKIKLHHVLTKTGIPVWLSHYRNQICHVPSESPCIDILVPLVEQSLAYMKDSFWSKVLKRDIFDSRKCLHLLKVIIDCVHLRSLSQLVDSKKSVLKLSKKQLKNAKMDKLRGSKACTLLRKQLLKNPQPVIEVCANFIVQYKPNDKSKNTPLLLEQIIMGRTFEPFLNKLICLAEKRPDDKIVLSWLKRMLILAGKKDGDSIRSVLKKMNLIPPSKKTELVVITPLKCCHIAYRLMKFEGINVRDLVYRLRHNLVLMMGKKRTILLLRLAEIVHGSQ